ncbi:CheR family methyltransferase [Herpetosiphon sp. NSE202]|uniref:CheR family methyltransferase n=1 Tax=Herpetosiphon sp. NSE202 TaxID=3351349 RepID=UPI0036371D5A
MDAHAFFERDIEQAGVFPVVGIGLGRGGIEPLIAFFAQLPSNSGMAFILFLSTNGPSEEQLHNAISDQLALPFIRLHGAIALTPNQLYLVPPMHQIQIRNNLLNSIPAEAINGIPMPIDHGLRALADHFNGATAAVILSGSGSDGVIGIKRVKEAGGVTLAQDPQTADYPEMPRAAMMTGLIDFIAVASTLPSMLSSYWNRGVHLSSQLFEGDPTDNEKILHDIFALLQRRTAHDFSQYKRPTIERRIRRRMQVTGAADFPSYLELIRHRPDEIQALFQDLLISVTNFFRDHEAWRAIEAILPLIFARKQATIPIRVWVSACATGEEAYTIAILLREFADTLDRRLKIQVFATDIDDDAITIARRAIYPATIAGDIREDRLQRFFVLDQGGYRVRQEIRDLVLFARHNVLHDPPFSQVDLLTCRNLLIYLNHEAQANVIQAFHFSLRAGGYLMLGSSESLDGSLNLFTAVDKKQRIFQRLPGTTNNSLALKLPANRPSRSISTLPKWPSATQPIDSFEDLHQRLLAAYTTPSVIINEDSEIIHLGRGMGSFLHFDEGRLSSNLLTVIHPDLRLDLRSILFKARQRLEPISVNGVRAKINESIRLIDLTVQPILEPDWALGHMLVLFHDVGEAGLRGASGGSSTDMLLTELEAELEHTRFQLRTTVDQYEAAVEEYKAANEELQAINEELRAASEELVTSKEELQSVNEELTTLNVELKHKVEEVSQAHNDLQNLITSTQIGTIFLDRQLCIKRFTPSVQSIFNLIPADLERPLAHVTHELRYDDLMQNVQQVLQTLAPVSREVSSRHGHWYIMRLLPYRTLEDRIDGVVITFIDITERKITEDALRKSEEELSKTHTILEARVQERTAALVEANAALQTEINQRIEAQKARQEVLRQLVTVQEDERKHLARELHDHIGQQLTAIRLDMQRLGTLNTVPEARTILNAIQEHLHILGYETHNLALSLRPTVLDDLGLLTALRSYGEQWQERTEIRLAMHFNVALSMRFAPEIETTIYRVTQEALTNIIKHAQASQVSLVIHHSPKHLRLIIEDNGTGFEYAQFIQANPQQSLGIQGIQERVLLLGGTVDIESTPGSGTTIYVQIPLDDGQH